MWFMFVFPECSTFLQSCLEKSPEARPSLETLRHSSWLRWSKQERERAPRRFADYCGPPWHSLFYCLFVCFVGPMGSRVRPCLVTVTSQQKGSGFKPDLPVRSLHFLPLYVGFLQAHWFLPQSEALMTKSDTKHEFYFTISPNVQNVHIDQIVFVCFFSIWGHLTVFTILALVGIQKDIFPDFIFKYSSSSGDHPPWQNRLPCRAKLSTHSSPTLA